MPEVTYVTTSQIASLARVDSSAVRTWVKKKKLKPAITTPGGHYRFKATDVASLLSMDISDVEAAASVEAAS
ncbi:UNVERIFIED_CONTAM: helix-turn-helix domain-containing protein [Mycobacterium avium subsp. hominissuis]|uniref:helix-turn-helix domain-containing protein n=1 Tax=Mycobacterium avium TaxID=1764 RepID=UPI0007A08EA0|nr:helix-turn-helix domain-containing protein [Mycobacterium avium]WOF19870.1 helix-turn-helix domain-containing protein [Mycobacterium avium]